MTRALRVSCALLALASAPRADVLEVPGVFATIQIAVDAAVPGDVVLVAAGTYPEAVSVQGKGISLVGAGGVVDIRGLDVRNVPAGQLFVGQHLDCDVPWGTFTAGLVARQNAGSLRFDDCVFRPDGGTPGDVFGPQPPRDGTAGAQVVNSADVAFTGCTFLGGGGADLWEEDFELTVTSGGPGLEVTNSAVVVASCVATGGNGGSAYDTVADSGGGGGAGVLNREGGRVEVHGSVLTGGHGGSADCEFFGSFCGSGGGGGDGVRQFDAGSLVVVRDNTYAPGGGGFDGDGGGPAPSGLDVRVIGGSSTTYPAAHRDFTASSPAREGSALTLSFAGQDGDTVLLFAALGGQHAPLPLRQGSFLLSTPLVLAGTFVGVLGPTGSLVVPLTLPELGPGVEGFALGLQAAFGAGGLTLLGPAPTSVLLDAGF